MDNLTRRVLPADSINEDTVEKCLAAMHKEYQKRWDRKTKPYPGIAELLSALDQCDLTKVILSNKPDDFTKMTVEKLLAKWSFKIVRGVRPDVPRKPDPAGALEIAEELNIPTSQFLYIGDTNTDMQTANSAGMYAVGALWGFRTAEELKQNGAKTLVEKPTDVLGLLS